MKQHLGLTETVVVAMVVVEVAVEEVTEVDLVDVVGEILVLVGVGVEVEILVLVGVDVGVEEGVVRRTDQVCSHQELVSYLHLKTEYKDDVYAISLKIYFFWFLFRQEDNVW